LTYLYNGTSVFHNHYEFGSITATLYLDPPKEEEGGGLELFFHEHEKVIVNPRKDYIYFVPSWVLHRPLPQTTNKIRHCLNWGYECSKRPIHKLTRDRW
jgi:hypothetical protein